MPDAAVTCRACAAGSESLAPGWWKDGDVTLCPGCAHMPLRVLERIDKMERLIGLLSEVYFNQDSDAIDKLFKELWPDHQ